MNRYVIDASVVLKWFFEEELSDEALSLLTESNELLAPAFVLVEVANVLAVRARRGEITAELAATHVESLRTRPGLYADEELLHKAMEIAVAHGRSVYDSLYVVLALREDCQVVTADEKLYNALKDAFPDTMLWLGDVPAEP